MKTITVRDCIDITLGSLIVAIAIQLFYVPHNIVTGGVTGIAIIMLEVSETLFGTYIPLWVTNITLNLPLLLIGYKIVGKGMFFKSLVAIVSFTAFISVAPMLPCIEPDMFISVIFGGGLVGIGTALILRRGSSSGGTVLLASVIQKFLPHIKMIHILFSIDFIIIGVGMFVFGPFMGMYAIVAIIIFTKATDVVISGFQSAKMAYIISEKHDDVTTALLETSTRGVTAISTRGAYTGNSREMLMCIMTQKELIRVKKIVKEIDPDAFVIVTSASEVLGNGFMPLE